MHCFKESLDLNMFSLESLALTVGCMLVTVNTVMTFNLIANGG